MAISPQYQFALMSGWGDPSGLVNVETLSADGRYFYAPVLDNDFVLMQPLSGGNDFERGYTKITWKSDLWRAQLKYLYATILSGNYSGKVTFKTLRYFDDSTYSIYRGYLALSQLGEVTRNFKQYQTHAWNFTRCVPVS